MNWDRISELREEVGEDDLAEVIALFCEEVEEVLAILANASVADIPGHLHFLKGSALNIGFDSVSTLCLREETKLKEDPDAKPDIACIQKYYATSKSELEGLF
ncbi:MAG: Hpt domain-containing protein [Silicimonas sp.]|nr:Hpt domain-containing protein [Silicimonas sp.]